MYSLQAGKFTKSYETSIDPANKSSKPIISEFNDIQHLQDTLLRIDKNIEQIFEIQKEKKLELEVGLKEIEIAKQEFKEVNKKIEFYQELEDKKEKSERELKDIKSKSQNVLDEQQKLQDLQVKYDTNVIDLLKKHEKTQVEDFKGKSLQEYEKLSKIFKIQSEYRTEELKKVEANIDPKIKEKENNIIKELETIKIPSNIKEIYKDAKELRQTIEQAEKSIVLNTRRDILKLDGYKKDLESYYQKILRITLKIM